ncbi:MAG: hypothetical protein IJF11_02390 [Clostridia bacterium]|nr:hypothetical protein [Clostridia bacterium]
MSLGDGYLFLIVEVKDEEATTINDAIGFRRSEQVRLGATDVLGRWLSFLIVEVKDEEATTINDAINA